MPVENVSKGRERREREREPRMKRQRRNRSVSERLNPHMTMYGAVIIRWALISFSGTCLIRAFLQKVQQEEF